MGRAGASKRSRGAALHIYRGEAAEAQAMAHGVTMEFGGGSCRVRFATDDQWGLMPEEARPAGAIRDESDRGWFWLEFT